MINPRNVLIKQIMQVSWCIRWPNIFFWRFTQCVSNLIAIPKDVWSLHRHLIHQSKDWKPAILMVLWYRRWFGFDAGDNINRIPSHKWWHPRSKAISMAVIDATSSASNAKTSSQFVCETAKNIPSGAAKNAPTGWGTRFSMRAPIYVRLCPAGGWGCHETCVARDSFLELPTTRNACM